MGFQPQGDGSEDWSVLQKTPKFLLQWRVFFQKLWTAHLGDRKYKSVCLSFKTSLQVITVIPYIDMGAWCWLTKYTLLTHSNGITAHGKAEVDDWKSHWLFIGFCGKIKASCSVLIPPGKLFQVDPNKLFFFFSLCKAWTLWCQSLTLFIMQEQRWSRRMQAKLYPQLGQIPV